MNMIKNEQILPIFWVSIIGRNNFGRRDGGVGWCLGNYDRGLFIVYHMFNYLSRITVKLKSLKELIAKVKFKIYVHKMSNSTLICYFLSWLALGIVYNTFFCLLTWFACCIHGLTVTPPCCRRGTFSAPSPGDRCHPNLCQGQRVWLGIQGPCLFHSHR